MSGRERNLKILGLTMLSASIYDWILAALIFLFPDFLTLFGIPGEFDLRLLELLLLFLPFFYILGYIDTERYIVVIPCSIILRASGFLLAAPYALFLGVSLISVLGFVDLLFGSLHYIFLKRSGYTFLGALLGKGVRNPSVTT